MAGVAIAPRAPSGGYDTATSSASVFGFGFGLGLAVGGCAPC